ncbi:MULTISPECIES: hypothetical protein [Bradyrhizobium]|uniref:hypothetical protein n=1 Tax=Bradyrhizobium TaxID=374 RepID=UPI0010263EAA|nr:MULTISPECIES: hypothetical protein [Bradyrhizobium]MDA9400906.1 hypothetical protein [Bradyrhizobium sp. CCBAU 45389]MDA9527296.1 hypothetical protein [Bradyrhizobium sp. CCBAU 25338]RXH33317.1 hypothetical protein XH84_10110 [Bradyrhizobium nanningense]
MPTIAHNLIDGLKERDASFFSALQGEDDLGIVIRAHIHIEHELQQFVLWAAPKAKHVKFSEMDFAGTLRLALTLGLHDEFATALRAIGGLRNRLAHRLDMRLGDQEVSDLYKALGPQAKHIVQATYAKVRSDSPTVAPPKNPKDLEPRDLATLCFIAVRGGVIVERLRVEGKLHAKEIDT